MQRNLEQTWQKLEESFDYLFERSGQIFESAGGQKQAPKSYAASREATARL
jgi:hypothetical protein